MKTAGRSFIGHRRPAFAFIFLTVALDMLAVGIMAPVLPKLVLAMRQGDMAGAAGVTGGFGLVWAGMQFIFSPVLGALSDRFGRRPVVLLSNLGLGLDYVILALAPSLEWLLVGRIISGITAASFSTAGAYVTDITPADQRAARLGMLGAAFGLGFVVGPAVGGLLGSVSLRLPFWVAACVSLLNALYGFFVLPESLPKERRGRFTLANANPIGSLSLLRSRPTLTWLAAAAAVSFLAHEALPSLFVLYTSYRYGWGEREVGLVLAAVGASSALVSGVLVGKAVTRLGERRTVLLGLVSGMLGLACYAVAPTSAAFLFAMPFIAVWGVAWPALQAVMTRTISPTEQGRFQGAMSSVRGITGMVGPVLFTQVFASAVAARGTFHVPGAPYFVAAILLACSATLAWRVLDKGMRSRPPESPGEQTGLIATAGEHRSEAHVGT